MAFAIKLQACTGVPGKDPTVDPDHRGGEPADVHETVRIPGEKGIEIDPVDDELLPQALEDAKAANRILARLGSALGQHLEIRIMDSDGQR